MSSSGNITIPAGFARDYRDTHAGFSLLCALLGLEIVLGAYAIFGSWLQRDVERRRSGQDQLEKVEISMK